MRILVTGATGFIGAHLVRGLIERHFRVFCLVRPSPHLLALVEVQLRPVNVHPESAALYAEAEELFVCGYTKRGG